MALRDEWVAKTIQTVGGVARGRAASRNGMSREGTPGRSLLVVFSFHHTISQPLFFAFTPLLTFSHDILTPAAILICPARSILCFNRRAMASGPSVWSGKDPLFAVAITLSGRARVVDNESHHSLTHRLFAFSSTTFIISIRLSLHHTALHCIASHRIASPSPLAIPASTYPQFATQSSTLSTPATRHSRHPRTFGNRLDTRISNTSH
jgi:hypothetical protein